jgi:hypothetical protein
MMFFPEGFRVLNGGIMVIKQDTIIFHNRLSFSLSVFVLSGEW